MNTKGRGKQVMHKWHIDLLERSYDVEAVGYQKAKHIAARLYRNETKAARTLEFLAALARGYRIGGPRFPRITTLGDLDSGEVR